MKFLEQLKIARGPWESPRKVTLPPAITKITLSIEEEDKKKNRFPYIILHFIVYKTFSYVLLSLLNPERDRTGVTMPICSGKSSGLGRGNDPLSAHGWSHSSPGLLTPRPLPFSCAEPLRALLKACPNNTSHSDPLSVLGGVAEMDLHSKGTAWPGFSPRIVFLYFFLPCTVCLTQPHSG